jgi:hypothetical protein
MTKEDLAKPWTDRLLAMYHMQRDLQLRYHGRPFTDFTMAERVAEMRIQWVALIKELGEALDEIGWKPWANYPGGPDINADAFDAEMVDAWHFFMNMMLIRGMTPDQLYRGYLRKNQINHNRISNGYDGVSSKCPVCHRELTDPGVMCDTTPSGGWCYHLRKPWPRCTPACSEQHTYAEGCIQRRPIRESA